MKSESTSRIRYRWLLPSILVMAVVALATWYLLINTVKEHFVASTGQGLALAASDIADKLDLFLFERFSDVATMASAAELETGNLARIAPHLQSVLQTSRAYQWIAVTDAKGRIIASTDASLLNQDHSAAEWFRAARDDAKIHVEEVGAGRNGSLDEGVIFSSAIRDAAGRFSGVAVTRSVLPAMDKLFDSTMASLRSLGAMTGPIGWQIGTRDGRIFHDSGDAKIDPSAAKVRWARSNESGSGWREDMDPRRSVPVLIGFAPTIGRGDFQGLGWIVTVRIDRADALHGMHQVMWKTFFGGAAIMLPVFAFAVWTVQRLRKERNSAMQSEANLKTTLRSMAEGVVITDATGHITMLNSAAETLTGWRENEAKGRDFHEVFRAIDSDTHAPIPPLADKVLREGAPIERLDRSLLVARDGTERVIAQAAAPIPGKTGPRGVALLCRDVTERELAERALRASQETFRIITENMTDVVTLHDLEGWTVFQSRSGFEELSTLDLSRGQKPFNHVLDEDRPALMRAFQTVVQTGEPQRAEYRMRLKNGEVIYVESVGTLIRRPDRAPDRVLAVSRNITERRLTEEKLRHEKEFTDTLLASLPGVFFICDWQGQMLRWNRNFEFVVGYSHEEVSDLNLLTFFPAQEQAKVKERLELCLHEGKTDLETIIWHRNGRLTAHYICGLRSNIDGRPTMLGVGIDVSAHKAAEEALLAASERLERQNAALGEQARNPALRGDNLNVAFQTITEVASHTLGVSRASIWFYQGDEEAVRCEDLFDHPSGEHASGAVLRGSEYPRYFAAIKEGRVIPAHYARTDPRTKDFADSYLKPHGITSMLDAPIRVEGRMIGVICHEHTGSPRQWTLDEQNFAGSMADLVALSLEVWQRRQAEKALREARDQLEIKVADRTRELSEANERLQELDRLKSEFLATMSHELRTPMNSIIGFTGILRQELAGPLNAEQKKQLGMVQFAAKHLLTLINDLLDLSRIESGKMDIHYEDFDAGEVIMNVVESLTPAAREKALEIKVERPKEPLTIRSDRKKVFQVLLNLANNAVKFTDHGSVTIAVQKEGEAVQFEVLDTGIGIKPEQMTHLFEAFRQVDGSARRVYEGTGLGLYLCKKLVHLLSGTIGAVSEFGAGSRFSFTLPSGPTTQSHARQDSSGGR